MSRPTPDPSHKGNSTSVNITPSSGGVQGGFMAPDSRPNFGGSSFHEPPIGARTTMSARSSPRNSWTRLSALLSLAGSWCLVSSFQKEQKPADESRVNRLA